MKKHLSLLFLLAVLGYPTLTWVVVKFYPDDPAKMNWDDREAFNLKYISQLEVDQSIDQDTVLKTLGGPDITQAHQVGTQIYQLMFYRTRREIADGITTPQECTALLFKDRQLIAKDVAALHAYQQVMTPDA